MNMVGPHDIDAAVQVFLVAEHHTRTPEQRIADVRQLLLIYEAYIHDLGT